MDTGFDKLEELEDLKNQYGVSSSIYTTKLAQYNSWLENDAIGRVFARYKDDAYRVDVPTSQSDKGDQDFYGLTSLKDVYLTYAENSYEPKYYNKNGDRIRVREKVSETPYSFYTAPKVEEQPVRVIEPNISTNSYEEAVYETSGS